MDHPGAPGLSFRADSGIRAFEEVTPMRRFALVVTPVNFVLMGFLTFGPSSTRFAVATPPPTITGLPLSLTLRQRSSKFVPTSADKLKLTTGDITTGQVTVSLSLKDGKTVLGPRSMKRGDSEIFQFGNKEYSLKLVDLRNALLGEDFADFTITGKIPEDKNSKDKNSKPATPDKNPKTLTESQKIEQLIATVETMKGAVFLRNNAEHSPKEAARHIRQKLDSAKGKITTATQFIDLVASKSSITGEKYQIRFKDGRTVLVGDFLRDELAKLETKR